MKRFEFLELATADVIYRAYGKSLSSAFENAALALSEVMINTSQVRPVVEKLVKVTGEDLKSLLFNWLNELLYLVDSEGLAFSRFTVKLNEAKPELSAKLAGEKIDPDRHELRTEVKACTYHKMEVRPAKQGKAWVQVLLDI